jgi:hypothetical protein
MHYYHPVTLEHICNPLPRTTGWALATDEVPPLYDPQGESCKLVGGVWVVAPAGPTLDELKAVKLQEINAAYDATIDALPIDPPKERETYSAQYMEAVNWQRDNTFPTPMVDSLLAERQVVGEDKAGLCQKIIAAAAWFGVAAGAITGKRQRLAKAIVAAETAEDVAAIDWG